MEIFRKLELNDLDECTGLFISVFNSEPWNDGWKYEEAKKRLKDIFQSAGFYGIGFWRDHSILGVACGNKEQWTDSEHFNLKEFYVDTENQHVGIGSRLLERLEQELIKQNCNRVYLLTMKAGIAESFYKKNGYYVNGKMIMMGKKLIE